MATGKIQQRIDPKLQKEAETILKLQGIKPSQAIIMFYSEVRRKRGFPFTPSEIPNEELAVDLREAESGLGIEEYDNEEDMFKSLKSKK